MPTAKQSAPAIQVTPLRKLPLVPLFGELTRDHDAPSQCSVIVAPSPPLMMFPTAQQSVEESQVMDFRKFAELPSGEAFTDHALPFQCTVSVWMLDVEEGSVYEPTAQQSAEDMQVTFVSELIDVGKTPLVSTIVQALPSHFSITPCVGENCCG